MSVVTGIWHSTYSLINVRSQFGESIQREETLKVARKVSGCSMDTPRLGRTNPNAAELMVERMLRSP